MVTALLCLVFAFVLVLVGCIMALLVFLCFDCAILVRLFGCLESFVVGWFSVWLWLLFCVLLVCVCWILFDGVCVLFSCCGGWVVYDCLI